MKTLPLVSIKDILQRISAHNGTQKAPERQFGALRGVVTIDATFFEPLPEEELAAWE